MLIIVLGQSSIPVLNRSGYSMFWLSSWDNLHSYSLNINEDILLRDFFTSLVNDKFSNNLYIDRFKIKKHPSISNNISLDTVNNKFLSDFFFRVNKIPYYLSKIRILKFQKWVVVYMYIYNPQKKNQLTTYKNFNIFKFFKKSNLHLLKKKLNFVFDF